MEKTIGWAEYYSITRLRPPRPLLVEALQYVQTKGHALDVGAGALADSRYLLTKGFTVTAIDQDPKTADEAKNIPSSTFNLINTSYESFDFPFETYDFISAQFALPFNPPHSFDDMFARLKESLKPGGVFSGQFFGVNDEWNTPSSSMTFHAKSQVQALLAGMEVLKLQEEEKDGTTANGSPKHWHIFHVIAQKT